MRALISFLLYLRSLFPRLNGRQKMSDSATKRGGYFSGFSEEGHTHQHAPAGYNTYPALFGLFWDNSNRGPLPLEAPAMCDCDPHSETDLAAYNTCAKGL
jgi:hypothetical protein